MTDAPTPHLTTERLLLRPFTLDDADFAFQLVTEPAFKRFVGDKGVADIEGARRYLEQGPMAVYGKNGLGFDCVVRRDTGERIGLCGLIDRDGLNGIDLGFAFLEAHWGHGFALEAARATMEHAEGALHHRRVLAITDPDNVRSGSLLEKLGFVFTGMIQLPGDPRDTRLFEWTTGS